MIIYAKRIRTGINLASSSFSFLWQNKHLVLYCIVPTIIALILQVLIHNLVINSSSIELSLGLDEFIQKIMTVPSWLKYVGALLINFAYIALTTTFNVAATYHAMANIKKETTNLRRIWTICRSKWRLILAWAGISTVLISIMQIPGIYNLSLGFTNTSGNPLLLAIPMTLLLGLINIAWMLLTYLVMPIITLEHVKIREALRLSMALSIRTVYEILGGVFIFTIVTILTILPRIILAYLSLPLPLFIGTVAALLTADCIISVTITIFKTTAYNTYYKEPMEQMEAMRHSADF